MATYVLVKKDHNADNTGAVDVYGVSRDFDVANAWECASDDTAVIEIGDAVRLDGVACKPRNRG